MFLNSARNINTKINKMCSLLDSINFSPSRIVFSRIYSSSHSENKGNKTVCSIPFELTEDLPAIPENYGFPGDENVKTLFELKRIRASFKYG